MIQLLPSDLFGLGEVGSSSATKAKDAEHDVIDAYMYIQSSHPHFIDAQLEFLTNTSFLTNFPWTLRTFKLSMLLSPY